ncbi:HMG box protein [Pestalotiopsis sp. NC0098]|nr:HMG box protein [Pestalotiopsis sp. NC0098]
MNRLDQIFEELGISQYLGAFVDNGFDSWETILDITESDLDALGVKLGHRRKLQRRIANHRGLAPAASLASPTRPSIEETSAQPPKTVTHEVKEGSAATKRKYRRHPKPDENAPERPPSAYVLFSNKMREDLKGQNLSFTEIAKLVGENWQSLDRAEKEPYETHAQELKDRYNRDMSEYKKTADYKRYSDYLHDFRKRQAVHDAHKRARVDGGDGSGRRSVQSGLPPTLSTATSTAGSSSESHLGSEPPPTRQQRLSSITSQSDSQASPVVSSLAFPRHPDEISHSPMSVVQDDKATRRSRGFSSPSSADQTANTPFGPRPPELPPAGHGLASLMQVNESRGTIAPMSHSPEAGAPSIMPGRPEDNHTRSGRTSISSQFWSRPPSLLAQQSSTGSVTSLSSFNAQPRTPSESSLPIHALLSSKPEPTMSNNGMVAPENHISSKSIGLNTQFPSRPLADTISDGRLPYSNGYYPPPGIASHVHPVAPITPPVNQPAPTLPRIAGGPDPGLDGMSALLRASDIVGRPEP